MGIWYHFAILFEALFILTTVDAGTRVCRFMIQDLVGNASRRSGKPSRGRTTSSARRSPACCGVTSSIRASIDPYGGIWTMWPLFGTANQMLAAIALILCTVVLFKMKRERFAWVTIVPATWLVVCTVTAGLEKVFDPDPAVGFVSHALKFGAAAAAGTGAGAGQFAWRDEPGRLQRLSRCGPRRLCRWRSS